MHYVVWWLLFEPCSCKHSIGLSKQQIACNIHMEIPDIKFLAHALLLFLYFLFVMSKNNKKIKKWKIHDKFSGAFQRAKRRRRKNFIFESKLMRVIKSNKKCKQQLLINFLNYNLTLTFFFARRRIVHGKNLFTQCILNITTYNSSMMKTSNDIEGCFGWW